MPQPHDFHWTTGLHALAEADERAWLDQWARLHLIPITPEPAPERELLAAAGRH